MISLHSHNLSTRLVTSFLSFGVVTTLLLGVGSSACATEKYPPLTEKEVLGQMLFFDQNLSKNRTMSCSTCHNPATAMVDVRGNIVDNMASLGDDQTSLGDRNAPTAMYAMFSPAFHKVTAQDGSVTYVGGQFLDGRSSTLADQAGGPPLNPIEMNMPDKASVVQRLQENPVYIEKFTKLYKTDIFSNTDHAYAAMTDAIAAFEKTKALFAPYTSKYDKFLRGEYELSVLEDLGRSLFFSNNNTNCSTCHKVYPEDDPRETFTNFEYHNIGVPENIALRAKTGVTQKDLGLYQNPMAQEETSKGKFKTSTLRNVAVTGPYMHNGVFKELRTVIEFYDHFNNPTRKINPETGKPWREPEVSDNLAPELTTKILTDRKVDALVAFLKILTDEQYESLIKE